MLGRKWFPIPVKPGATSEELRTWRSFVCVSSIAWCLLNSMPVPVPVEEPVWGDPSWAEPPLGGLLGLLMYLFMASVSTANLSKVLVQRRKTLLRPTDCFPSAGGGVLRQLPVSCRDACGLWFLASVSAQTRSRSSHKPAVCRHMPERSASPGMIPATICSNQEL